MKKIQVLSFFLISIAMLNGQTVSVTWGPELFKPKKTDISKLIGSDASAFYCLRTISSLFNSNEYTIEKYSKSKLSPDYIRELKLPLINDRKLTLEKIVFLKGSFLIFTSRYDSEQDKNFAYIEKRNASDGSVITSIKEIDYINSFKKRNKGSFEFVFSNDSSKILVVHNEPYEKYANEKFSYRLLDNNANLLWSASLELPYKDKYFGVSNYCVDESGKVFMLANVTKEKSERERKKPRYAYHLISYDPGSGKLHELPVNLDNRYISDISFGIMPKGNIVVSGFFSNESSDGVAGVFYLSVDKKNDEILLKGSQDFSSAFLSEFMSEKRAKKRRELFKYKIDHLIAQEDGGLYMIAEQYYVVVVTQCNPRGGCTTTYNYYYNDIIVVNLDADASVKWIKKIPKAQMSANDFGYYSSYSLVLNNEKLNFIFNDHPKNLEDKKRKRLKNGISRKMVTVHASIDAAGNISKTALFSAKEERIYTRPKIALQLDRNHSLFYAIKRKKYKFGIINF